VGAIEAWATERLSEVGTRLAGAAWGVGILLGLVVLYFAWRAGTPWFVAAILAFMAFLAGGER